MLFGSTIIAAYNLTRQPGLSFPNFWPLFLSCALVRSLLLRFSSLSVFIFYLVICPYRPSLSSLSIHSLRRRSMYLDSSTTLDFHFVPENGNRTQPKRVCRLSISSICSNVCDWKSQNP